MDIRSSTADRILVGEAVNIVLEYYVSIVIDREVKSVIPMLSREGGMDIEPVAKNTSRKVHRIPIDPLIGIPDYLVREAAFCLSDDKTLVNQAVPVFQNLYHLLKEKDASLAEINPLVMTKSGKVKAINVRMIFDNSVLYRHPDVFELPELAAEERKEQDAKSEGFSYVSFSGEIGYMVNSAGLTVAAMDMIRLYGGNPADFLDIGSSFNSTKIVEAMKLLLSDGHVRVALINIFGGITRCDDAAKGLVEAFRIPDTNMPTVTRLTDTNEAEGRELLKGTKFHVAETMSEADKKAAELTQQCMNK